MALFESSVKRTLRAAQISDFCRHVGAMCSAGVPLTNAMEILQKGAEHRTVKRIYGELQHLMEQGFSFGSALEETGAFPELLLNMFRAAEVSGQLEETAKRMAIYYRKEHKIKSQIQTATLYPKILCLVSVFVVMTIMVVVVPIVEPLFRDAELPFLTRVLLVLCDFVKERWYAATGVLAGFYVFVRVLIKNKSVRLACDRIKLMLPLIGRQYRTICTARFARSESSLYSSGLPMVESLAIAARTIDNLYLEMQFVNVIKMVQGGLSLCEAIESVKGLDPKLAPVIFVGEESGKLGEMLEELAESYEYDAEMAINRLVAMVEPTMILVMGAVVGLILLGIMVPMWSIYEYMA